MSQSVALSRNLSNNVAAFTMPNQSSVRRINLRLLLKIRQGCSGIAYKFVPGGEVLKRLEPLRDWCTRPDASLVIAQAGNALLRKLVSNLTVQVGRESYRLIAIPVSRSTSPTITAPGTRVFYL